MFDLMSLTLAVALWQGAPGALPHWPAPAAAAFRPREREVTNWRGEALASLDLPWKLAAALAAGRDARVIPRCVRLNNYWCIKRAGWAGEIAADNEGHVAFSSAAQGADVAALLLRRYYLDYGRHSALAIVSHWAPAECGGGPSVRRSGARPSARPDGLAVRGVGNTLRARFLASRGRRVAGRAGHLRRSIVADRVSRPLAAPSIAVGLGERPIALPTLPLSDKGLAALAPATGGGSASAGCSLDQRRIRAYADSTAAGIEPSIDADLKLFTPDGQPTPNLARAMRNMAAVEIGPLAASDTLIRLAVERARVPRPIAEDRAAGPSRAASP